MFGAGGGTSSYSDVENTDVILLWGSNARVAHPIFFHHALKGIRTGARLYGRGRYTPTREQGVHHFHRLHARDLSGD